MKKIYILLIITLLSCVKEETVKYNDVKLIVGIQNNLMSSIVTVANELGFFKNEGLDVIIKSYPSGKLALKAMLNGDVHIATSSEIPIVFQSFKRDDFSIFSSIAQNNNGAWIIGRRDSGINSIQDLKGKRIATQKNSAVHFFLHLFLLQNNIRHDEVEIIFMEPTELTEAVINKEVDAISMRDPFIQKVKNQLGTDNTIEFFDPNLYLQPFVLSAMNTFQQKNSEILIKFITACIRAEKHTENNFRVNLNQSLLITLEDAYRWSISDNLELNKNINYLDFINTDILKSINPDIVKILSADSNEIIFAQSPQPLNGLIYIAEELGYFEEEDLDITYLSYTSGRACLDSVLNGKSDLATAAASPFVNSVLSGESLYNIGTIQNTGRNVVILGNRNKGIKEPNDLKGKVLGVSVGSGGEFFVDMFLLFHSINKKDLKIINILPEDMLLALKENKVDAVCTWNPHVINIQNEFKDNVVTFYAEELYRVTFNLIGKKTVVERRKKSFQKILKALIKAEVFIHNNKSDSIKIISKFIDMEEEQLNQLWEIYNFQVALDNYLVSGMNELARWVIDNKDIKVNELPDFTDYIYVDILKTLKPEVVKIK